jgi:hypothetical protein
MQVKDRKILFFDIDGTLITEDGKRTFPESAKRALAKARELGHLVFINTGRVYCNVTEAIKSVGFDGYVCGCGSSIFYNGEELFHNDISRELCHEVAVKCREYGMFGMYEHRDKVYIDGLKADKPELAEMVEYFRRSGVYVGEDVFAEDFEFDKFCCWFPMGNPKLPDFKKYVSKEFEYIDRGDEFCEVVPKGFSKATGIEFLLRYFDIPLENAYAFGDGNNDAPMLLYCPNSIIMKKGPEELKQKVMLVTDDVENDGIEKAMIKLGIIPQYN